MLHSLYQLMLIQHYQQTYDQCIQRIGCVLSFRPFLLWVHHRVDMLLTLFMVQNVAGPLVSTTSQPGWEGILHVSNMILELSQYVATNDWLLLLHTLMLKLPLPFLKGWHACLMLCFLSWCLATARTNMLFFGWPFCPHVNRKLQPYATITWKFTDVWLP